MIAIKNNIPYKSSSLNIATEGDTTSESQIIEIPTDNNKMLRITNLYIPPVKTTSEVSASQRENQISMDLWPSETYDMMEQVRTISPTSSSNILASRLLLAS